MTPFVRSGACLQGAAQQRYAAMMEDLAAQTTRFAPNSSSNPWEIL